MADLEKFDVSHNVWKPDPKFSFPRRQLYGSQRKFVYSWLRDFPWLAYLQVLDGAFCAPCVFYGRKVAQNSSKVDKLMKSPLTDWSSACNRFKEHQKCSEIHKTALETMHTFSNVMKGQLKSIDLIQGELLSKSVEQNRLKLTSIAKTILLCARQNIPLCGHRDDAKYYDTHDCVNFQAPLDFRMDSRDTVSKEHFKSAPRNATYRSKTIQNELISCIANNINI